MMMNNNWRSVSVLSKISILIVLITVLLICYNIFVYWFLFRLTDYRD